MVFILNVGNGMEFNCHGVRGSRPVSMRKQEFASIISNYILVDGDNNFSPELSKVLDRHSKDTKDSRNPSGFKEDLEKFVVKKIDRINKSVLGYASKTPCVEVRDKSLTSERIIFDLGTGASDIDISKNTKVLHIFFTHFHYDHVQGMLFFNALYNKDIQVHFYSPVVGFEKYLQELMHHPYFPVTMSESMTSKIYLHELHKKKNIKIGDMTIVWKEINHPGGCYAYKISNAKKTFCYFSDVSINEILFKKTKENKEFLNNIDTMILDASMSFEDSIIKRYYGHSNFYLGLDFIHFWGIKKVLLFHFDPADDITSLPVLYQSAQWYKTLMNINAVVDLAQEEKWIEV